MKQPCGCAQSPLSGAFPIIILLGNSLLSSSGAGWAQWPKTVDLKNYQNEGAVRDILQENLSRLHHCSCSKFQCPSLLANRLHGMEDCAHHQCVVISVKLFRWLGCMWQKQHGFLRPGTFFVSPLSLRRGVVVVCFEVTMCELLCLMACAMWSRGSWLGGCLVSACCFCCFAHLLVWPCDFVCRLFCFICHTLSRWYNAITLALISPWTGTCHTSVWLFCFGLPCFVLVVWVFCFVCFGSCCCFLFCLMTSWQTGLCTGPLPDHSWSPSICRRPCMH